MKSMFTPLFKRLNLSIFSQDDSLSHGHRKTKVCLLGLLTFGWIRTLVFCISLTKKQLSKCCHVLVAPFQQDHEFY